MPRAPAFPQPARAYPLTAARPPPHRHRSAASLLHLSGRSRPAAAKFRRRSYPGFGPWRRRILVSRRAQWPQWGRRRGAHCALQPRPRERPPRVSSPGQDARLAPPPLHTAPGIEAEHASLLARPSGVPRPAHARATPCLPHTPRAPSAGGRRAATLTRTRALFSCICTQLAKGAYCHLPAHFIFR